MIKQTFDVESYYEVVVFYDIDYNLFTIVEEELLGAGISQEALDELYWMMYSGRAKAVTYSNLLLHKSIVIFNPHEFKTDYVDSIVHEAEHVKQAMLACYQVEDKGEPPAYTIGYLVGKMWGVFKDLVCDRCY